MAQLLADELRAIVNIFLLLKVCKQKKKEWIRKSLIRWRYNHQKLINLRCYFPQTIILSFFKFKRSRGAL